VSEKELFQNFPIFSDIPQEHASEIARHGEIMEFESNDTVFHDGENACELYGLLDGEIELSFLVKEKLLKTNIQFEEYIQTHIETIEKQIVVDSIEPGEIFGWSSLVKPNRFSATAKCSKPARIFSLPADKLKLYFEQNPQIGFVFMEHLTEVISHRLKNRTNKLIEAWSEAFDVNRI